MVETMKFELSGPKPKHARTHQQGDLDHARLAQTDGQVVTLPTLPSSGSWITRWAREPIATPTASPSTPMIGARKRPR